MINRVRARAQELWGKSVVSEAEAYAQAVCEEIEKINAAKVDFKPEVKKITARKAADE